MRLEVLLVHRQVSWTWTPWGRRDRIPAVRHSCSTSWRTTQNEAGRPLGPPWSQTLPWNTRKVSIKAFPVNYLGGVWSNTSSLRLVAFFTDKPPQLHDHFQWTWSSMFCTMLSDRISQIDSVRSTWAMYEGQLEPRPGLGTLSRWRSLSALLHKSSMLLKSIQFYRRQQTNKSNWPPCNFSE